MDDNIPNLAFLTASFSIAADSNSFTSKVFIQPICVVWEEDPWQLINDVFAKEQQGIGRAIERGDDMRCNRSLTAFWYLHKCKMRY